MSTKKNYLVPIPTTTRYH